MSSSSFCDSCPYPRIRRCAEMTQWGLVFELEGYVVCTFRATKPDVLVVEASQQAHQASLRSPFYFEHVHHMTLKTGKLLKIQLPGHKPRYIPNLWVTFFLLWGIFPRGSLRVLVHKSWLVNPWKFISIATHLSISAYSCSNGFNLDWKSETWMGCCNG